jgi:hypothetical protein
MVPDEIVRHGIIDRPEDFRMDELRQIIIFPQGLDAGDPFRQMP